MEVAQTRGQGVNDMVVLHRYSIRDFTLSCPVKVYACPSEGAETGSWMTPASMPDVTAQLGRLMTEGPGPAHTCPSWAGKATPWGEKGAAAMLDGQMFLREDSRGSSTTGTFLFLFFSLVIGNHVKGQLCDTACPSFQVVPFGQNNID